MANITINEISQNYTYNIGNNSYATVALPITACWGPGYEFDNSSTISFDSEKIENTVWSRYQANQAGLEAFVAAYRGPATQYLARKDFSYQQAMTLLTSGYDVLICRVSGGTRAENTVKFTDGSELKIQGKYPGTFGNSLQINIRKLIRGGYTYWNAVIYVVDSTARSRVAVENLNFVFDLEKSTDSILHISELDPNFIRFDLNTAPNYDDIEIDPIDNPPAYSYDSTYGIQSVKLVGGVDHPDIESGSEALAELKRLLADSAEKREEAEGLKQIALVAKDEADAAKDAALEAQAQANEALDTANTKQEEATAAKDYSNQLKAEANNKKSIADEAKAERDTKQAELQALIDSSAPEEEIAAAQAAYDSARDAYTAAAGEYQAAKALYEAAKLEYDNSDPENPGKKQQYEAARDAYDEAKAEYDRLALVYDSEDEENPGKKQQYDAAKIEYETAKALYEAAKALYEEKRASYDEDLVAECLKGAKKCAQNRFAYSLYSKDYDDESVEKEKIDSSGYISIFDVISVDKNSAIVICDREWVFNAAYQVLNALMDKLAYNPNRVIVPGWDDQDILFLSAYLPAEEDAQIYTVDLVSPLHQKLMEVAYYSRCATAYLDIPRSIQKSKVYNESEGDDAGYAQKLARIQESSALLTVNGAFYPSHSALFAPWGKYMYVGTGKQHIASPSFLALLIDRAMIKNQTSQYEWELPTNRKHNLRLGKLDYVITKKYLDEWQSLEGVGVNCITAIPDLGTTIWGNSTLYEVPPATYQALANLSTRKLVNAVEDLAYRCGISITFQYNNDQAYNAFYAGMTPLLDTMRNVGAIEDYYLRMAEDVNGLDQVNANSVVGKIYLVVKGVINDITVDLIALPPTTSLDEYRA